VELDLGGARLMPIRAWMSSPARPRALPLARGSCGGCRLIVQLPDTGLPRDDELTAAARLVVDLLPSDGPASAGVVTESIPRDARLMLHPHEGKMIRWSPIPKLEPHWQQFVNTCRRWLIDPDACLPPAIRLDAATGRLVGLVDFAGLSL